MGGRTGRGLRPHRLPRRHPHARLGHARHRPASRRAAGTGMTISRRTFLLRSAEVALGATAASLVGIKLSRHPAQPWNARAFASLSAKRSTVAVVRATQYDEAQLEQLVHDGLASIGAELDGRTVLLK